MGTGLSLSFSLSLALSITKTKGLEGSVCRPERSDSVNPTQGLRTFLLILYVDMVTGRYAFGLPSK